MYMSGKPWCNFASRKESMSPADGEKGTNKEFVHVSLCACLMSIFPLKSSFNHLSFFSHMQRPDGTSKASQTRARPNKHSNTNEERKKFTKQVEKNQIE